MNGLARVFGVVLVFNATAGLAAENVLHPHGTRWQALALGAVLGVGAWLWQWLGKEAA